MEKFKAFAKSEKLHFNEITSDLLKRFEAYLKIKEDCHIGLLLII